MRCDRARAESFRSARNGCIGIGGGNYKAPGRGPSHFTALAEKLLSWSPVGLTDLLLWFDAAPARYWWVFFSCLAWAILLCLVPLLRNAEPRSKIWVSVIENDALFGLAL